MEEKLIPQNIAAEQSVLGALLIDKTAINRVVGKLKKEDASGASSFTDFQFWRCIF